MGCFNMVLYGMVVVVVAGNCQTVVHDLVHLRQHFHWLLTNPIRERQRRSQQPQIHPSDLCSLFVGFGFQLFLPCSGCLAACGLHLTRSSASSSQLSAGRSVASISLLQTSLKRSLGLPTGLNPSSSSPYKRSLGIRPYMA